MLSKSLDKRPKKFVKPEQIFNRKRTFSVANIPAETVKESFNFNNPQNILRAKMLMGIKFAPMTI